jgi:trigger factor
MMVSEVRRRKALAVVLGQATVTDTEGKTVDLTDFVSPGGEEEAAAVDAEEAVTEAPEVAVEEDTAEAKA